MIRTLKGAFLAGIAISLGGVGFLSVGGGFPGAVLFIFGLLTVIHYKLPLYTGSAGFFTGLDGLVELAVVLGGNILGCWFTALSISIANPGILEFAGQIIESRQELGLGAALILAGWCGFIMTTVVQHGRSGKLLPLLFGIPLFILSGYLHSIADSFYYLLVGTFSKKLLGIYLITILGNFLGCNLYRTVMYGVSNK